MALMSSDLPRENSATNAMTSLSSASRSSATSTRRAASASSISASASHWRNCTMDDASASRHWPYSSKLEASWAIGRASEQGRTNLSQGHLQAATRHDMKTYRHTVQIDVRL